jgi:hypothetical protein
MLSFIFIDGELFFHMNIYLFPFPQFLELLLLCYVTNICLM